MKRFLILLALGTLFLAAQGALAKVVPVQYVPDLGMLTVFGVGLCFSYGRGLLFAAALGYIADALGGSLLGQWALVYMIVFQATRAMTLHLNLQGVLPRAGFVFVLTFVCEFALAGAIWLFQEARPTAGIWSWSLVVHAVSNALVAPIWGQLIVKLAGILESDRRRDVHLEGQRTR